MVSSMSASASADLPVAANPSTSAMLSVVVSNSYGAAWSAFKPSTRSEEHTSELQSLMRISYAVFFLKKKKSSTMALCSWEMRKTHIYHLKTHTNIVIIC